MTFAFVSHLLDLAVLGENRVINSAPTVRVAMLRTALLHWSIWNKDQKKDQATSRSGKNSTFLWPYLCLSPVKLLKLGYDIFVCFTSFGCGSLGEKAG